MKTDFSINIGARIRHFRELAGLTQLQLSEKLPCEPSTLAHYETGKNLVSMTRLQKIAEVLNVEPYQFFVTTSPNTDSKTIKSIETLLKNADSVQLGIIYNLITNILELTSHK